MHQNFIRCGALLFNYSILYVSLPSANAPLQNVNLNVAEFFDKQAEYIMIKFPVISFG